MHTIVETLSALEVLASYSLSRGSATESRWELSFPRLFSFALSRQ